MAYEYKVIGAPERGQKKRGARTGSDRVAVAFEALLAEHATDGWEYQRTDLVPVEEKTGLFSKRHEIHRAVVVFRRELVRMRAEPAMAEASRPRRQKTVAEETPLTLSPKRRTEERSEPEIRLAHSSDGSDLKRDLDE